MDFNNVTTRVFQERVAMWRSENGDDIFIEASGGISIENIQPYLNTGINAISIGALTHQAISKDIRLEFIS